VIVTDSMIMIAGLNEKCKLVSRIPAKGHRL
jgi:hypothetical protein